MLYDVHVITWLRQKYNILGVLIGTLPQIPSQNVFLGLPLELLPEEARLLVERRIAYVVDDMHCHRKGLDSETSSKMEELRATLRKEGLEIANDIQKKKQARTQQAMRRVGASATTETASRASAGDVLHLQGDLPEETLFSEQQSPEERSRLSPSRPSTDDLRPWAITPATSTSFLPLPSVSTTPSLPKVNRSSYYLFKHLHDRGYFMTPGLRFGCQFSVYPGDPLRFHSHFLAVSAQWDEEIDLLHLVGGGRLGTGVKKGWMVGGPEGRSNGEESVAANCGEERIPDGPRVRTFSIEWGGM